MNHFIIILTGVCMLTTLQAQDKSLMNPTLETIFQRKSVRHFKPGTVTKEQLDMLVRAGMAAPTAVDCRPWEFIVVSDKALLNKLADELPYAKMAKDASAAIMVLGDLDKQFGGKKSLFWIMDCSAATENILLAAESMKLGAVWTAIYPDKDRVEAVKKILKIPGNRVPLNLIPVGNPTGQDKPKNKYNPEQIHWNKW
ncbi:MAG: nitroreductase family protein [bacterium]|nr:nitroreductase family protein [bacterium]